MSNYQLITDASELPAMVAELEKHVAVGFDTETTALDPHDGRLRLLQFAAPDAERVYVIDLDKIASDGDARTLESLAPVRQILRAARPVKVAHNAKFDAKWSKHHLDAELGAVFDTMLASQMISAGETEDRHSLLTVVERYLGQTLDKEQQTSDWSGELSDAQLSYAARDASIMLPLRERLIEKLKSEELIRCAQLEFECVIPVAELELNGFFIDKERWREQIADVEKRRAILAEDLQAMLAVGTSQGSLFENARAETNIDSHTQLTAALKRLGVPVPDSTRNWKLQPLAEEYPVVAKLLEYRTVQKSLTSYGENILDPKNGYINLHTNRIHANFHQIGAPTGRFACLAGETLVATPAGFKRMDEVQAGDLVKTPYGFKRVERAWMTGVREVYKLRLKDGRSLRATADHRFLTGRADEWKQLCELAPRDAVYVCLKNEPREFEGEACPFGFASADVRARKSVSLPQTLTTELCELIGLIIADGFLGARHERPVARRRLSGVPAKYDRVYLAFGWHDDDLIEQVNRRSRQLFGQPFAEVKSRTCRVFQLASTKVAEFFAALGLVGNAHTKVVPEIVWRSPVKYQASFLRGLFEGDGYHSEQLIGLTSVNHSLLQQAQLMLANLGIYSQIKPRRDQSGFNGSLRYDLKINKKSDAQLFMRRVGFISARKNFQTDFRAQSTDDIPTPFAVSGAQLYREAVAAGTTPASRLGVKPFVTHYKNSHIKSASVEKMISRFGLLPGLQPVKEFLNLNVRAVEIESIAPDGTEKVYDITVQDVHQFVANGIVVHNCTSPNIQQVPHAQEYRRCFRAETGNKLIISDFSQIELRILAHITEDQGFIDAFNSGADLHKTTAAQVFSVPLEEVTSEQRSFAKRLNFGVVYGIGAQRFSMMTGLSLAQAEDILRRYFATYRALDTWLREAARKAVRERWARTLSGRLARFNFDAEDRQAASLAQRNGKNMPIQGCVSGTTRLFEASCGYIAIKDLENRKIKVWDGERFVKAAVAYSGKKQLVRVELWGGHRIECSPEHKFLTTDVNGRTAWRTPEQFVKGCYVALTEAVGEWAVDLCLPSFEAGKAHNASRVSVHDAAREPFGLGVWLGRLASDGSISERQAYLLVAQHEETILPEMISLSRMFGHVSQRTGRGGKGDQSLYSLTTSALGLCRQLTKSGVKTRVPDFAWRSSRILAGYLRGIFDGDGTVTPDGAALCFGQGARHLAWAREIQQALLLFGIRGRINICRDRVNVCVLKRDSSLFASRIGFLNPAKQKKIEAIRAIRCDGKIYGRAARIKSVVVTDEYVDMYDVIDSETSRFMANGLVTHNSSADILKRGLRLLHEDLRGTSGKIVNIVHDEIVVEAKESEAAEIAKKVEDAMCQAGAEFVTKVPVKVETEIADEWVK